MLRLAAELGPQLRLLRRNSGRTGIQMALPRHIAAQHHQHSRTESVLISAEEGRDQDVPRRGETAVCTQPDASTHPVLNQYLLRLGQPPRLLFKPTPPRPPPTPAPPVSRASWAPATGAPPGPRVSRATPKKPPWPWAPPAATVPTPQPDTSFTPTAARGLTRLRS